MTLAVIAARESRIAGRRTGCLVDDAFTLQTRMKKQRALFPGNPVLCRTPFPWHATRLDLRNYQALTLSFFVWRSSSTRKILRPDLSDIELGDSFAHGLEHIFEWWKLVFDPSQRVDTRYHK
jgi:hypothetical protein